MIPYINDRDVKKDVKNREIDVPCKNSASVLEVLKSVLSYILEATDII